MALQQPAPSRILVCRPPTPASGALVNVPAWFERRS
jgi:hypothetical protein